MCRWPIDVSPAVFEQKGKEFVKRKKLKLDSRAKVKKFEQEKVCSACIASQKPAALCFLFGDLQHVVVCVT